MALLFNSMVQALRAHWQTHDNTYPQKFVLTPTALQSLNELRHLVDSTMGNKAPQGWESNFLGVTIESGDTNCMIGRDGNPTPLEP